MKNIIFILSIIFLGCSSELKKEEIDVKLTLCNKNTLCISIYNNTKKKIFIPEIRSLGGGLRLFAIDNKNNFIDISDKAKSLSYFCFNEKEYNSIKECCKLSDYKISLSYKDRDSIASEIVSKINNKDTFMLNRIKNRAIRLMEELILIEPGQCFNDYFHISDSLMHSKISVIFKYPYKYPVILTGPGSLSKEEIIYNKKLIDSLHFEYPKNIKGYELYDKSICSKPIIVTP